MLRIQWIQDWSKVARCDGRKPHNVRFTGNRYDRIRKDLNGPRESEIVRTTNAFSSSHHVPLPPHLLLCPQILSHLKWFAALNPMNPKKPRSNDVACFALLQRTMDFIWFYHLRPKPLAKQCCTGSPTAHPCWSESRYSPKIFQFTSVS